MNAIEVIEAYVDDVARQLPRKQRNDVAFELRSLLSEELQAKADDAGRGADAAMAIELVRAFGRPGDVAARYRPALTIIDPADGHTFLRASVIGLALIWSLGLFGSLRLPIESGWDVLTALGRWWGSIVIPSLWWPGVLVAGFGLSSWARQRWPRTSEWQPRSIDRDYVNRPALALGLVAILCGVFVLVDPRWILDVFFGGRAAPAAYEALTYTGAFRQLQAPLLLVLIVLNIPMLLAVIVNGRWSATLRRLERALALVTCAVMAWSALDGPVLMTATSDRTAKGALMLIAALTLIDMGVKWVRSVRPAPSQQARA